MKKKIFGGIAILALVVMAAWNVSIGLKANGISDVKLAKGEALANVEALSDESENKYELVECSSIEIYDDATGIYKKIQVLNCTGKGENDCKC